MSNSIANKRNCNPTMNISVDRLALMNRLVPWVSQLWIDHMPNPNPIGVSIIPKK